MAVVFTIDHCSAGPASIIKHLCSQFMMLANISMRTLHPSIVSRISPQFPTRYRYPGSSPRNVLVTYGLTWRVSHRSNGNMSPVCQLARSSPRSCLCSLNSWPEPPGGSRLVCWGTWPGLVTEATEATTIKRGNDSVSGPPTPNFKTLHSSFFHFTFGLRLLPDKLTVTTLHCWHSHWVQNREQISCQKV